MSDFIISRIVCPEDQLFCCNFQLQKFSGKPEVAKLAFLLKMGKNSLNYYH